MVWTQDCKDKIRLEFQVHFLIHTKLKVRGLKRTKVRAGACRDKA